MELKEKLDFNIRNITVDDYPKLIKWWQLYEDDGVVIPRASLLPNKGLGGFVVEKNGRLIASAFLYFTNSALGYVDYLIADPDYREDDRQDVLIQLAAYVTDIAVKAGCETVWAMTSNKKLINMIETHAERMEMNILPDDYRIVYTYDKQI